MTDEAMSPLRRRMIEDMTIRKFAPKDPTRLHPHDQGFCCVPRSILRRISQLQRSGCWPRREVTT